jgi:hypothetical protein
MGNTASNEEELSVSQEIAGMSRYRGTTAVAKFSKALDSLRAEIEEYLAAGTNTINVVNEMTASLKQAFPNHALPAFVPPRLLQMSDFELHLDLLEQVYFSKCSSPDRTSILCQCIKITRNMVHLQAEFLNALHTYLKDQLAPVVVTLAEGWRDQFQSTEESIEATIKKCSSLTEHCGNFFKVILEDV